MDPLDSLSEQSIDTTDTPINMHSTAQLNIA